MKNILSFLKKYKTGVLYLCALNLFLMIPSICAPVFKKIYVNHIFSGNEPGWLIPLIISMALLGMVAAFMTWLKSYCVIRLENNIEIQGVSSRFIKLITSPLSYFNKNAASSIIVQLDKNDGISRLVTYELVELVFNLFFVIFNFIMMLNIDVKLSLLVIGIIGAYQLLTKLAGFIFEKLSSPNENIDKHKHNHSEERSEIQISGVKGMETLKITSTETVFLQRLIDNYIQFINANRARDYENAMEPLSSLSEVFFMNALLLFSAFSIMNKTFSIGEYLAFQAYAATFLFPLESLLGIKESYEKFSKKLVQSPAATLGGTNGSSLKANKLKGYIEFKNVSFGYTEDKPVIKNLTLSVKPGERVAVVGMPGAGKTTLLMLLQGNYLPSSGEITIDGLKPDELDSNLFVNSIGCANQNISIFSASVKDNITLWDSSVSDADIYYAASDACIHDFISSHDDAYELLLDEDGRNLSGGQRQRVELARALLYNPSILLTDEATSAIDPINSKLIEEKIKHRGATLISVTHKTRHLKDYDKIVVLNDGEITEQGTYDELMAKGGGFARLTELEAGL